MIDKHPLMIMGYSKLLQSRGFLVKSLLQIDEQFYEDILSQKPSFIVIDCYQFPIETHRILRLIQLDGANIKVIALSECNTKVFEENCRAAGVSGFLSKSQEPERIFYLLR